MTVFDVYVNDRKLCRAGVGSDGVLNAIVSWVKLTGAPARAARRNRSATEEILLHIGGLRGDTHRRWSAPALKAGDRVTIAVVNAARFDPPSRETPRDPRMHERQERRYYQRLKKRFEGPSRRTSRVADDGETRFLNVDLDIWSRSPLEPLVEAFGREVAVLHVGKEIRRHGAHLELASSGDRENCDALIRQFAALVARLPRPARTLWNRADARELNIGIQSAATPFSYELRLEPRTLRAAAAINARIVFTVYAATGK